MIKEYGSGFREMVMFDKLTGQKLVCPWWLCFTFDNPLRRLIHDPEGILRPYVREGDRAIDIGSGMGYFTVPPAQLVGAEGHVTAIDIQSKMLAVVAGRAARRGVSGRITTHLVTNGLLGDHEKADFILAFWMVHEVPDQQIFLAEILNLLKSGGLFLLVEPFFHVPEKSFRRTIATAEKAGFAVKDIPKIRLSRSILLMREEKQS